MIVALPFIAAVIRPDVETSRSEQRPPLRWDLVAQCESGGNWQADTGNGYEGGLQFAPTTWDAMGGRQFADHAYNATEAQQIEIAERLYRLRGAQPWPYCGAQLLRSAA